MFAVNVAVQFPLLIRFGYTRIAAMSTSLSLAVICLAVVRLHLDVTSFSAWRPLIAVAAAAALAASAALATSINRRRPRQP